MPFDSPMTADQRKQAIARSREQVSSRPMLHGPMKAQAVHDMEARRRRSMLMGVDVPVGAVK